MLSHVRYQALGMAHMTARANGPGAYGSPRIQAYETMTPIVDPLRDAWPQQSWLCMMLDNARGDHDLPLEFHIRFGI